MTIVVPRSRVEMPGEVLEAAPHDLGKELVAARVMLVRRLMRDTEPACDITQTELLYPVLGDRLAGSDDTCLAKIAALKARPAACGHARSTPGR